MMGSGRLNAERYREWLAFFVRNQHLESWRMLATARPFTRLSLGTNFDQFQEGECGVIHLGGRPSSSIAPMTDIYRVKASSADSHSFPCTRPSSPDVSNLAPSPVRRRVRANLQSPGRRTARSTHLDELGQTGLAPASAGISRNQRCLCGDPASHPGPCGSLVSAPISGAVNDAVCLSGRLQRTWFDGSDR